MGDLASLEPPRWTIRDHPDLFDGLRREALATLRAVLATSLDKVDAWLVDCLRKAPNFTPMQQAQVGLRAHRGTFEQAYADELQRGFAALHGRILPEPSAAIELSLMEDDELEGLLASESMVAALQTAHALDFDVLARRLAVMAGRASLKDTHNPLSAARLASALQAAQHALPMPDAMRGPLFKTYERELIAALGCLLPALSARLAQAGILPNLDRPPDPVEAEDECPPLPAAEVYQPGNAPGIDVRETFNALRNLLSRRRPAAAPAPARVTAHDLLLPDLTRDLDETEIVALLSLMQPTLPGAVLAALSDSGATLAELIKEQVLANVGTVGRTRDTVSLSQNHEDAIDLVGMLFGVLFEEREFVERSRQLLAQLVVPYVKVAVIDLRVFQFTTHPARQLLNALAESLEGNRAEGVHERALQKQVESVVQRLLAGFKLSISIFPKLDTEFRDYLARHRQRVEVAERRAAEQQSGQERLEHARDRAEQTRSARVADRALPPPLAEFLSRYWTHHAAMVMLREGDGSPAWKRATAIVDHLLMLHALGAAVARRSSTAIDDLTADLPGVLQSSGVIGDAASDIVAGILAAIAGPPQSVSAPPRPAHADAKAPLADGASTPVAPPAPPKPASPAARPAAPRPVANASSAGPGDAFVDEDLDLVAIRRLTIGDWIELSGDDGKTRPLKLSWVSPISGNMVFVNRHGARMLVASAPELVELRHQGRLLMHAHGPLFDHAVQRIQDRLEAEMRVA